MVTSIARQSVILKCNMQRAVMLGNYEFYYGAGVAGKIGGFEIPDDIKPLELRELLDKNLDQISPKDEKETYLIHILKEFRPDELYDEQMKELLLWERRAVSVECQYSTVTSENLILISSVSFGGVHGFICRNIQFFHFDFCAVCKRDSDTCGDFTPLWF